MRYHTPAMFKQLTKSAHRQTVVFWILIMIIVLPMIISLSSGSAAGGSGAGTIFGRKIPWPEYQQEYRLVRSNLESQLGQLPEGLEPIVEQQVWDRLMLREAARKRVKVSDEELARYLQQIPAFQENGRFSKPLYERMVQGLRMTPQGFEARVRDDLRMQKLMESVQAEATVSDEDIRQAYLRERSPIRAELVVISTEATRPQIAERVTDTMIQDAYAANPEAHTEPAARTIAFISRNLAEAAALVAEPTEEEQKRYYEERIELFHRPDGQLPTFESSRDDVVKRLKDERATTHLADLAADLEADRAAGLRLEQIANARGLSIKQVGPLTAEGDDAAAERPAEFMDTAFSLEVGGMSRVMESPMGVWLLSPIAEQPPRLRPLEEVRGPIREQLINHQTREAVYVRTNQLRDELLWLQQAGWTLDTAYEALELTPLRPAPFAPNEPIESLGLEPSLGEELTQAMPGTVSSIAEIQRGAAFGRVLERLPIDDARLAQEREAFRERLLGGKRQERFLAWMEQLRQEAKIRRATEPQP